MNWQRCNLSWGHSISFFARVLPSDFTDTNIDEGQSLAGTELSLQVTGSLVSERLSFVVNDASQNTLTTTTAQDTLVEDDSSIDSPSMFGGSGEY